MNLLQLGEYAEGWAEAEWRWQTEQFTAFNPPQPRWQGGDIRRQNLLVHTEQGAGDAIQFIRYMPLLAKKCQKLILVAPAHLVPIFETVEGIDLIDTAGDIPLKSFDTYIPLMSLPYIFGTTLDNIPNSFPYIKAPSENKEELINFIASKHQPNSKKVGIVWAGNPTHSNDHNRSCKLEDMLPLLELPDITFYSLQVGDRAKDINQLSPELKAKVADLTPYLKDYGDTAVAIEQLDLVISVDTSVAHLAGALSRPVWTALCYNPDWRWLIEGDDTPWYPSMKLFRQPQPQDWRSVFTYMAKKLVAVK